MRKTILFITVIAIFSLLLSGCGLIDVFKILRPRTTAEGTIESKRITEDPENYTGTDFKYKDNGNGTCTITEYTGSTVGLLNIPGVINGLTVTVIGGWAFSEDADLAENLEIPGNTCSITIPDSITVIESNAFWDCSRLTGNLKIPDSVKDIGDNAFYFCDGLTGITIPKSVKTIGNGAFNNCKNLKSIDVSDQNNFYSSQDGILFNKDKSILIKAPDGIKKENYVTPDSITTISNYAFSNCNELSGNLIISENVTSIGYYAFSWCNNLTGISLPGSVTCIGDSVFTGCNNLKSIDVSEQNECFYSLDGVLLSKDKSELIAVPSGIEGKSYAVPNGIKTIGNSAFSFCNLTSITLPGSVTSIGNSAFFCCSDLKDINIPDNVTVIGNSAFDGCSKLKSITIPDSVTTIENWAFNDCRSLEEITLPNNLTTICGATFYNCWSLTDIKIPQNVTTIEYDAFADCSNLKSITLPDGITKIESRAFYDCRNLQNVNLPAGLSEIGSSTFYNCSSLTEITIPDGVTVIDEYAFFCCRELTNITIPKSVTTIGDRAFYDCRNLNLAEFSGEVPANFGNEVFDDCSCDFKITYAPSKESWFTHDKEDDEILPWMYYPRKSNPGK